MREIKKNYEITVIIPTYKPQNYIKKCLISLENQTFLKKNFEVLVILNGEEKELYYNKIQRILKSSNLNYRILYEKKSGVSNARNIGIENSFSKYIVFIDDDDFVSKNFLKNLYETHDFQKDTLVASNTICIFETGEKKLDYLGKNFKKEKSKKKSSIFFLRKQLSNSCGKLIPRDIIKDVRFNTKLELGEDSLFMLEILKNLKKIELSSIDTHYYRYIRNLSATRKKRSFKEKNLNKIQLLKAYLKILFYGESNKIIVLTRVLALIKKR